MPQPPAMGLSFDKVPPLLLRNITASLPRSISDLASVAVQSTLLSPVQVINP